MDLTTLSHLFANPPAAYRPMMFWLWNGDITPQGIEEQIADFADKGCGGFFLHPMGESFRLRDFVRGMTPPYLSEEFFQLVRHAAQTAQRHGLYAWLYDEGGWPSGTAQGQVAQGHPEFRGKRLHARHIPTLDLTPMRDNIIAAVGLPEIGVPEPVDLRELAQGLRPYDELIVFSVEDDGYAVDVLNPEAVHRFIHVTHERYAEHVGEFFGNTIPGIFTDETSLGGRLGGDAVPWFGGMLELLSEAMGRDARTYLPLLFSPQQVGREIFQRYSDHEVVAARCEYYDLLTRRFGDSYWRQISDWCGDHNLIHTGHVGGEDNLPDHLTFGHFFRTAGALHLPGVDVIWRQLFPGQPAFPFPRLASSAMKQQASHPEEGVSPTKDLGPSPAARGDNPWADAVLTETNAVYGFGLNYGQMRWLLDIQAQHGVNLYAPMASYYTTTEGRLYGTMSHCGPGNPLWPYYRAFADYVGRVCLLARQGHEAARVAVYYPIEAIWTIEGADEAWESVKQICETLTRMQIPFDFIDADSLSQLAVDVGRGFRGDLSYETFIIPAVLAMPASAMTRLAELREAAAPIIILDHWPLQPAEMDGLKAFDEALARLQQAGAAPTPEEELGGLLAKTTARDHEVLEGGENLFITSRGVGSDHVHLLTNNSDRTVEPILAFDLAGPASLEVWDLRDGEVVELPWKADLHPQEFQPVLPPWSSLAVTVRSISKTTRPPTAEWPEEALELERWLADPAARPGALPPADVVAEFEFADRVKIVRQYVIAEGTVGEAPPEDLPAMFPGQPAPLRDWSDWPLVDFSGEVAYELELVVADELLHRRQLLLDLGQVHWVARVELNDEPVADLLWAPYTLDVSGRVRAGSNRLRITVANTLANQACRAEVEQEARERGWWNPYLERALPMMREDLRSGLLGPVRLMVTRR